MKRRRPSWYTEEDARRDRAARYGGSPVATPAPIGGVLAHFTTGCDVCGGDIVRLVHTVIPRKGLWIHARCASGADDE